MIWFSQSEAVLLSLQNLGEKDKEFSIDWYLIHTILWECNAKKYQGSTLVFSLSSLQVILVAKM